VKTKVSRNFVKIHEILHIRENEKGIFSVSTLREKKSRDRYLMRLLEQFRGASRSFTNWFLFNQAGYKYAHKQKVLILNKCLQKNIHLVTQSLERTNDNFMLR
jgi:hypothetical protein